MKNIIFFLLCFLLFLSFDIKDNVNNNLFKLILGKYELRSMDYFELEIKPDNTFKYIREVELGVKVELEGKWRLSNDTLVLNSNKKVSEILGVIERVTEQQFIEIKVFNLEGKPEIGSLSAFFEDTILRLETDTLGIVRCNYLEEKIKKIGFNLLGYQYLPVYNIKDSNATNFIVTVKVPFGEGGYTVFEDKKFLFSDNKLYPFINNELNLKGMYYTKMKKLVRTHILISSFSSSRSIRYDFIIYRASAQKRGN